MNFRPNQGRQRTLAVFVTGVKCTFIIVFVGVSGEWLQLIYLDSTVICDKQNGYLKSSSWHDIFNMRHGGSIWWEWIKNGKQCKVQESKSSFN